MTTTQESGSEASLGETGAGTETDSDEDAAEEPRFRHDAFLCYSHANSEAALSVQHGLRRLATSRFRRSSLSVFRDDTNLASTPSLWPSIAEAVKASKHLIVLASPDAAKSKWVNREIAHFLDQQPRRQVHLVLLDGTLVWNDAEGRFDEDRSDALPPSLRDAFDEEPLILDLRELHDSEDRWTLNDGTFRRIIARLAAPIRGLSPGDLDDADRRGQRRALRQAQTAISLLVVLLLVAVTTGVVARNAQRDAEHNATQAERQQRLAVARQLVAQSNELRIEDPRISMLLAATAVRYADIPEARAAMLNAYAQPGIDTLEAHEATTSYGLGGGFTLEFNADGSRLASSDTKGNVLIWDTASHRPSGEPLRLDSDELVTSLVFGDEGALVTVTGIGSQVIQRWDVDSHERLGEPTPVPGMTFEMGISPDGETVATIGFDGIIQFWDAKTAQRIGHPRPTSMEPWRGPVFSSDNKKLAAAGWDGSVQFWDVETQQRLGLVRLPSSAVADAVAFSPDGRVVAISGSFREKGETTLTTSLQLWDMETLRPLGEPSPESIVNLDFSPDGELLAGAGRDGAVHIWDASSLRPLGDPLGGHTDSVTEVAFSPDGQTLASTGLDGTVRLWDPTRYRPVEVWNLPASDHGLFALGMSGDGDALAASNEDGLWVWDLASSESGKRVAKPMNGHTGLPYDLAISPDGTVVASAGGDDETVRVWDMKTGELVYELSAHAFSVTFSPDGSLLAAAGYPGMIWTWDTVAYQGQGPFLTEGTLDAVAFSSDGQRIVAAGSQGVMLWDVVSRRSIDEPLPGVDNGSLDATFSPDGRVLAYISDDGVIRLWDMAKHRLIGDPFDNGEGGFTAVRFSPSGQRVAAVDLYGDISLWDLSTHQVIGAAPFHDVPGAPPDPGEFGALVEFIGDDRFVTLTPDGTLELWSVPVPRDLPLVICSTVGSSFTREEWDQYLSGEPFQRICP